MPLALVNTKVVKLPGAWQLSQAAEPIGTCVEGSVLVAGAPTKLRPAAWQVAQATPETAGCTIAGGAVPLALVNTKVVKLPGAWQLSQAAEPIGTCVEGSVLVAGAPTKLRPEAWQAAQAMPATAACTMAGGAVPLVLVNLKPPTVKLLGEWQLSQAAAPKAIWLAGGSASAGGAMLAKLLPAA